ncbi:nuclear transcription factor Y subunit C-4-like [Iris pallida]|uniref:Nuclear transcription factor Y subunit C-4-like n=1 Tax=Iris pallida TaxID=29817 RepID=A0AAX6G697_IRIPA|nr:nuclear transcription factor Y subunit C-4-like [Iris pallida]
MENNNNQQQQPPSYSPASFHHLLQQQHEQLQMFWNYQRQEIEHANDFKNHQLPLARIKKIMKADEDVRMISAEAPILFAKACELFILELTIRSWLHAEENKRRTLQRNDIAAAITRTDIFDFLVDIVPREEIKEEASGIGLMPGAAAAAAGVPYYYPPAGQGLMMGQPAMDPGVYMQQQQQPPWQPMWQHGGAGRGYDFDGQGYVIHPPPPPPPT